MSLLEVKSTSAENPTLILHILEFSLLDVVSLAGEYDHRSQMTDRDGGD